MERRNKGVVRRFIIVLQSIDYTNTRCAVVVDWFGVGEGDRLDDAIIE